MSVAVSVKPPIPWRCFALLDDCHASATAPTSRLYTGYLGLHRCHDTAELEQVCQHAQAEALQGRHLVVLADYEWGSQLVGINTLQTLDRSATTAPQTLPSLYFLVFETVQHLSCTQVTDWLQAQDNGQATPSPAGIAELQPNIDETAYQQAIAAIHGALAQGESYQINYTYRLNFQVYGTPVALYRRLREQQPVPYGALIALPDERAILSCSPELFVAHQNGQLICKPMKGTAARTPQNGSALDSPSSLTTVGLDNQKANTATATALAMDEKNRAENIMIVDLLRNDLGRIAATGSVNVPALFSIEPYHTVFQMTSTITARLQTGLGFADVLRALFPCGSVTGAPKHQSMQLIAQLETTPRGLYTGAIGWLEAPANQAACGDFCLSVAIRTLTLDPLEAGARRGQMGLGSGIVIDSQANAELTETRIKARFLTGLRSPCTLFETLRAERDPVTQQWHIAHWPLHRQRLQRSAEALDFMFDASWIEAQLQQQLAQLNALSPLVKAAVTHTSHDRYRLRLNLHQAGEVDITCAPLLPLPRHSAKHAVKLVLAQQVSPRHYLLQHKTSVRQHYDEAVQYATEQGAFDALFFNELGELTEGGRSNVFLKLNGQWWTPPITSGVLPGVMRHILLHDPDWAAQTRVLTRQDLDQASDIIVCNTLRGVLSATL